MVKRKVVELEGRALDWATAKAIGQVWFNNDGSYGAAMGWLYSLKTHGDPVWSKLSGFRPSADWAQGGPLIERYKIGFGLYPSEYFASLGTNHEAGVGVGETHLIAACRAIVASELGEEVEIPEELANA